MPRPYLHNPQAPSTSKKNKQTQDFKDIKEHEKTSLTIHPTCSEDDHQRTRIQQVNNKATINTTTIKDKGSFNKATISTKTLCESTLKDQVRFTKAESINTRTIKDQVGFTREAINTATREDKGSENRVTFQVAPLVSIANFPQVPDEQ
jgi:hypothetical protein